MPILQRYVMPYKTVERFMSHRMRKYGNLAKHYRPKILFFATFCTFTHSMGHKPSDRFIRLHTTLQNRHNLIFKDKPQLSPKGFLDFLAHDVIIGLI